MSMTPEQLEGILEATPGGRARHRGQDGRPRSCPIWFHWENGAAYMFTGRSTLKWRNLEANPHASLCVDKREPPYAAVVMDGPVQESDRPIYDLVLGMALRYYGEEKGRAFAERYRNSPPGRVVFMLTPQRIASFIGE